MFYNDLSDNGKSFEFGYDSKNGSYGYYKDGVFTEFGGGGGVSTQCKVKRAVWYIGSIPNGNTGFVQYCDNDGNYWSEIPGYGTVNEDYKRFFEQIDFIRSATVTSSSNYAGYVRLVLDEDGFYSGIGTLIASGNPTFYSAGSTIDISVPYHGLPAGILCFGLISP